MSSALENGMTTNLTEAIEAANEYSVEYGMTYSVVDLTEGWYAVVSGQCDISVYVTI